MPRVARFSIAPVRSLGLQHPTEIELTEHGVVEDRRFYLTNDANRLVDQLTVFKLVQVASRTDPEATTLWMRFPDGTEVDGEVVPYSVAINPFLLAFSVTVHPGVAIPLGLTREGLPFDAQLVGRRWDDARLLGVAGTLSQVAGPCRVPPGFD